MKRIALPTALILIVVLSSISGLIGGITGYQSGKNSAKGQKQTSSVDENKSIKSETSKRLICLKKDKEGDCNKSLNLKASIEAPLGWRVGADNLGQCQMEDSGLQICATLYAKDVLESSEVNLTNQIRIYDVTKWLEGPEGATLFESKTAVQRKAAYDFFGNLSSNQVSASSQFTDKIPKFWDLELQGGPRLVSYIESADGQLRGVAFFGNPSNELSYNPRLFSVIAGKIKDRAILAISDFNLRDDQEEQVESLNGSSYKTELKRLVMQINQDIERSNFSDQIKDQELLIKKALSTLLVDIE